MTETPSEISSDLKKARDIAAGVGTVCFVIHTIVIVFLVILFFVIGGALLRQTTSKCDTSVPAVVDSVQRNTNTGLYTVSVTYKDHKTGSDIRTSFNTPSLYTTGSDITLYTSEEDPAHVCESSDDHTGAIWLIVLGIIFLIGDIILGIIIFKNKTFRAGYGAYCGFQWLSSLFFI